MSDTDEAGNAGNAPGLTEEQFVEFLAKMSVEGESFYREFMWVRILLWNLLKYRPDDFTDDEAWEVQMQASLTPRDMHLMYAVLVLWNKTASEFNGDPKAKVLAIHKTLKHSKEVFAAALHMAHEVIGVKQITIDDIKYDGEMVNIWREKLKADEMKRRMDIIRQQIQQKKE